MSSRVLWIALLVSLALNFSFIGAWGYSAFVASDRADAGDKTVEELVESLGLNAEQRDALIALRESARERWRSQGGGRGGLREIVVAGLGAPTFDRAEIEGRLNERMSGRADRIAQTMEGVHGYLQTLNEEQRQAFLERAKERGFLRNLFGRPRKPRPN